MEPIFAQLSLEYFKDGKTLPWNKVANPILVTAVLPHEIASVPKPSRGYFSL